MRIADLLKHYPSAYHVSVPGTWPLIQRHGLLSTTAILDKLEITDEERATIELAQRPESLRVGSEADGYFVLRDQKPLSLSKLEACLEGGISADEWLRRLNRKVFFWLREHRFRQLANAQAYRGTRQQVITIDTALLVRRHGDRIELCHMNSGTTRPMAHPRGPDTFKSIEEYPFEERRRMRGLKDAIAELTVDYSVPDVAEFVLRVEEFGGDEADTIIWER